MEALTAEKALELGKLYCDRGEFDRAMEHLLSAHDTFRRDKNHPQYLRALNLLLRIYAEREEFDKIHTAKEQLQDLVLKEGLELSSKTYYTLSLCATYKNQFDVALDYLQKALALGLAADHKEDICNAIFGIASVYARPEVGRAQDALKEIYNLKVFFQIYNFPELKVSVEILNADILRQLKKFDEAIDLLWKAYDLLKQTKSMIVGSYLLGALGNVYYEMGDNDMARMYLSLAQRTVDPKNQIRLYKLIRYWLDKIGCESQQNYDLIFDEINHSVFEKKLGRIDFKNQFILLDLLKLFVINQGVVYSKEYLVENVWKQPYDPAIHDNKIYVTIKRLRKLIEPDYEKPRYIFRAKNGYYMSKSARVHLEKDQEEDQARL